MFPSLPSWVLWLAASVRQAVHFSSRKEVEDEGWRLSGAIDQLMVSDIPGMIHFIWWFSYFIYFWGISKSFCHECPKRSAEQTLVPGHSHSDGQRLVFSTPRHRGFNALNVVAATWQQDTGIAFLLAFLTGPKISKDHQSQYPKPLWPISANFVGRTSLWILHFLSLNLCVAGASRLGGSLMLELHREIVWGFRWQKWSCGFRQMKASLPNLIPAVPTASPLVKFNRTPRWDDEIQIVGECFWKNDQIVENYACGVTLASAQFLIAAWCWLTGRLGRNHAMHAGCVHAELRAYVKSIDK